ncbi:MAG: hypothetical protein HRT68_07630 [Flavobacteriaceae bacterium]|nr:hypothetical protein [Flavobacteriaceae bacterium]
MKKIIIIILLAYCFRLSGQEYILDSIKSEYEFIAYDKNELKFADSSKAFKRLFNKLDKIANDDEEKVHVFHIGGSHIQADIYSNKLRSYLQNFSKTSMGQRGMIFPYKMAKTNNPRNYKVEFDGEWNGIRCSIKRDTIDWGLNGVTAFTKDSISNIKVKANYKSYHDNCYNFNRIRVFYDTWPPDYEIEVVDQTLVNDFNINEQAHYIEFSLTKTLEEIDLCIKRLIHDGQSEFLMMGIELMNDNQGVEYTSIGVNGASFDSYDRCEFFEDQLLLYSPDLFIISIGTNDTYTPDFKPIKYKAYYEGFIQLILRANPDCAILLTVPNDSYYKRRYANPNTKLAAEVIYELAQKYNMAVWDFYEIMGGLGSSQKWYRNKLMPRDRIHFKSTGYSIKADLLLQALTQSWEKQTGRQDGEILNQITQKAGE